jgi:hypothetical protein
LQITREIAKLFSHRTFLFRIDPAAGQTCAEISTCGTASPEYLYVRAQAGTLYFVLPEKGCPRFFPANFQAFSRSFLASPALPASF